MQEWLRIFFFWIKDVNQVKEQISVSEIKALQQNKNFYVIYITVLVFLNIWKFSYIATFKRGRNIWCFFSFIVRDSLLHLMQFVNKKNKTVLLRRNRCQVILGSVLLFSYISGWPL